MAPIRIGFIGLSSSQSWATWAHLPYLKDTSKYEVVALCNSSIDSAKAAIKTHGLPDSTKAYGSATDLAADPNIQLVVCSVRVDKHYDALVPVLKAGKDAFCEWPLAKNYAEAQELVALAKANNVNTLVGLQAHVSPALNKIKEIIDSGKIGTVKSTTFHGTPRFLGAKELEMFEDSQERSHGGNLMTIYTMHALESITHVLGTIKDYTPLLDISHPEVTLTTYTGDVVKTVKRTSHDQVLLQGHLSSGTVFSFHLRGGPAFANENGAWWRFYGDKGEIQVTGPASYLQIAEDDLDIEVFEHGSEKAEKVVIEKDGFSGLPLYGRNVARLYDAFADGKGEDEGVLGWETAAQRHGFVEEVYRKAGVQ